MSRIIKILSIDGGGIRGMLPAVLLAGLEEKIQKTTGNADARLADYFDFFAGTSIGGLLSCIYLTPDEVNPSKAKYAAKQAPEFYFTYANNAFKPMELAGIKESFHKYSPKGLEAQIKVLFKDLRLSQLMKPCCITAYNLNRLEPCLFLSQKAAQAAALDYFVGDILRATSALPGIFPPAGISSLQGINSTFVDGGIFAHNPAFYAYLQAKSLFPEASGFLVLSLGTGHVAALSKGLQVSDNSDKNWARLLAELAFGNFTGITDLEFEEAFNGKPYSTYIRLQPSLEGLNSAMDDASPANIKALYDRGQAFLAQNDKLLQDVAEKVTIRNQ